MNTQVSVAVEHATEDVAWVRGHQEGSLPGLLGFEWSYLRQGEIGGRFEVRKHHLSPTGFLHAATVVALADTACGYGTFGKHEVETPSLIRYGQMTRDEMFVTASAALNGVTIANASKTESLVMLKHFGPGNPDAPTKKIS